MCMPSVPTSGSISRAQECQTQQRGAFRIGQLASLPVGSLSADEIPRPFALLTARYKILCCHCCPNCKSLIMTDYELLFIT